MSNTLGVHLDPALRRLLSQVVALPYYDLIFDIETNGFRHAGMQVHCVEAIVLPLGEQVHGADRPGYTPISVLLDLIAGARRLIGHNLLTFDVPAIERVFGVSIPRSKVVDTLVASRVLTADRRELDALDETMPTALVGKHSLDSWGWRLRVRKDDFLHRQDQPWSKVLQDHCELDTVISWAVFEELRDINPEFAP